MPCFKSIRRKFHGENPARRIKHSLDTDRQGDDDAIPICKPLRRCARILVFVILLQTFPLLIEKM